MIVSWEEIMNDQEERGNCIHYLINSKSVSLTNYPDLSTSQRISKISVYKVMLQQSTVMLDSDKKKKKRSEKEREKENITA